jgi:hypothetical protein
MREGRGEEGKEVEWYGGAQWKKPKLPCTVTSCRLLAVSVRATVYSQRRTVEEAEVAELLEVGDGAALRQLDPVQAHPLDLLHLLAGPLVVTCRGGGREKGGETSDRRGEGARDGGIGEGQAKGRGGRMGNGGRQGGREARLGYLGRLEGGKEGGREREEEGCGGSEEEGCRNKGWGGEGGSPRMS